MNHVKFQQPAPPFSQRIRGDLFVIDFSGRVLKLSAWRGHMYPSGLTKSPARV